MNNITDLKIQTIRNLNELKKVVNGDMNKQMIEATCNVIRSIKEPELPVYEQGQQVGKK